MRTNVLKTLAGAAMIFIAAQFANAQTNVDTSDNMVTTQNVTRAGSLNSVNGAPDAFGVTGVGRTTPANSLTVRNNTGSTNSVATGNSTSANETTGRTGAVYYYNNSQNQNGNGILQAFLNRRANTKNNFNFNRNGNGLVARLLAAGSISSGNSGTETNSNTANNSGNSNNSSNISSETFSSGAAQIVNFDLVFFERGGNGITKRAVTTSDIVAALGDSTGNNFSTNALLIYAADTNGSPGTIAVVDGNNTVDVSSYFSVSNSDTQITGAAGSGALNQFRLAALENGNLRSAITGRDTLSILYVTFNSAGVASSNNDANLIFHVNGFNTTTSAADTNSAQTVNANVSGTGKDNGQPAIVTGTITASGTGQ